MAKAKVASLPGNQVIAVIPNVSMQYGHNTLAEIARREGYNIMNLKPGQFLMFLNPKLTAFKMFAANYFIVHHKCRDGSYLSPDGLADIEPFFHGGRVMYPASVIKWAVTYYGIREKKYA